MRCKTWAEAMTEAKRINQDSMIPTAIVVDEWGPNGLDLQVCDVEWARCIYGPERIAHVEERPDQRIDRKRVDL